MWKQEEEEEEEEATEGGGEGDAEPLRRWVDSEVDIIAKGQ